MTPPIVPTITGIRDAVADAQRRGASIGFVPTMGALHAGHAELIRTARRHNDFVVVSIFVNPTQFGPTEDFDRYPRPLQADQRVCAEAGADAIFAPSPTEMYPPGFATFVEVTGLQDRYCGASRPGHFRGVATVVLKLLNIVGPDAAYFGEKDAQQVAVLRRLVLDLNLPTRLDVVPTVREADGLAMSSRNVYLTPEQRPHAASLYRALSRVREAVRSGQRDATVLTAALTQELSTIPEARLDYAVIVDDVTWQPVSVIDGPARALAAVFFGSTRLIDNVALNGSAAVL